MPSVRQVMPNTKVVGGWVKKRGLGDEGLVGWSFPCRAAIWEAKVRGLGRDVHELPIERTIIK